MLLLAEGAGGGWEVWRNWAMRGENRSGSRTNPLPPGWPRDTRAAGDRE